VQIEWVADVKMMAGDAAVEVAARVTFFPTV
jgi:hypothetical protein